MVAGGLRGDQMSDNTGQSLDTAPTDVVRHRRQSTPVAAGRFLQQRPPLRPPSRPQEGDWKSDENVKPSMRADSSIEVDSGHRPGILQRMASEHLQPSGRKQSFSSSANASNQVHVKVVLRCRPFNIDEQRAGMTESIIECRENTREVICVTGRRAEGTKGYSFDGVCGPTTSQQRLFENHVVPLVEEVLQGFNCTIFAYGQTGTGKTFTMEGDWSKDLTSEPPTPTTGSQRSDIVFKLPRGVGVIPRSVALIFERLAALDLENSLKVSFLEIYNEELIDLLQDGERLPLRIFDSYTSPIPGGSTKGLAVKNLQEVSVENLPDVYRILSAATKKRRTAETSLNRQSSRSHSIFTITITMKETTAEGEDIIRIGKLNLVDLAGSENISRSGTNNNKDRAKEAGIINQSLVALGRVITALTGPSNFIPYRDSKLTRLLQESLGGRTKTCIIATVSPSPLSADETISTLDYAHRAKHIKNRPEVNQKVTQKFVLKEMSGELEKLRKELALARERSGDVILSTEMHHELETQVAELHALKKAHSDLRKAHETTETEVSRAKRHLEKLESEKNDLEEITDELESLLLEKLQKVVDLERRLRDEKCASHFVVLEEKMIYDDAQKKKRGLMAAGSALLQLLRETEASRKAFATLLDKQRASGGQDINENLVRIIDGAAGESQRLEELLTQSEETRNEARSSFRNQIASASTLIGSLTHADLQNSIREIRAGFEELLERSEDSLTSFGKDAEDLWRRLIEEICGSAEESHLTDIFLLFKKLMTALEAREEAWSLERAQFQDENARLANSLQQAQRLIHSVREKSDDALSAVLEERDSESDATLKRVVDYLEDETAKDREQIAEICKSIALFQDQWMQRSAERSKQLELLATPDDLRRAEFAAKKDELFKSAESGIGTVFAEVTDVLGRAAENAQTRQSLDEQAQAESKKRRHELLDRLKSNLKSVGGKLVASQNSSVSKFTEIRTQLRDASLDALRGSLSVEKGVLRELAAKRDAAVALVHGPLTATFEKHLESMEVLGESRIAETQSMLCDIQSFAATILGRLEVGDREWDALRKARFSDDLAENIRSLVDCFFNEPTGFLPAALSSDGAPTPVVILRRVIERLESCSSREDVDAVLEAELDGESLTTEQKTLIAESWRFAGDRPLCAMRMTSQRPGSGDVESAIEDDEFCLPRCVERRPKLREAVAMQKSLAAALSTVRSSTEVQPRGRLMHSEMPCQPEDSRTEREAQDCIQRLMQCFQDFDADTQSGGTPPSIASAD